MQELGMVRRTAVTSGEVPLVLRFLGKLVIEVLPAALASIIGGLLFAHYQFSRPDDAPTAAAASPASPAMVRLVRDEHAVLEQFLAAQQAAEKRQMAAADAQDARALADAQRAAARSHAAPAQAEKPAALRRRPTAVAAASLPAAPVAVTPAPPSPPAPAVIATAQQSPSPAPAHDEPALIAGTLAVKDQVIGAALDAVKTIGGIPLWLGRRFSAEELSSQAPVAGGAL